MILYMHGFNSSPLSGKAQEMQRWLRAQGRDSEWMCPALPDRPAAAISLLSGLIENAATPPKLVGSSLGGFYATVLAARYGLKAVVINPATHPGILLKPAVGQHQQAWHSDATYEFTQTHLDELWALQLRTPQDPDKILLLQERGDEVLDWQDARAFYRDCHQLVFRGGDHGFTRFRQVLELIDRF